MRFTRRDFLKASALLTAAGSLPTSVLATAGGESIGGDRPLLKPVHDMIVCAWTPQHPRHDQQLVFPLDDGFTTWKRSADSMTAKGRGCHEPTIVEPIMTPPIRPSRSWATRRWLPTTPGPAHTK